MILRLYAFEYFNMADNKKDPKRFDQFKQALKRNISVPESEWDYFVQHLSERSFEKDDYIARSGDIVKNFYFITKGLVRFFYSTEDGKEFNKHFAMENGFAGSFHSLVLNVPCGFYIQTMERTETIVLPTHIMKKSYERHPCWERLGRILAERVLLQKEAREKELLLDSLDVRYQRFLNESPEIAARISQYHIASYLGVTDVALSRIRKKILQ